MVGLMVEVAQPAGGAAGGSFFATLRQRAREGSGQMFRSLSVRNFRLYFVGQIVSVSGTWMQSVAQAWLVVAPRTGLAPASRSGIDLGIVVALQFLPMLLFGPVGGLVADRFDKRKILYGTQSGAAVLALALGLVTAAHEVRLWQVEVLALLLGFVNLFDNPARQSFVLELVGRDHLPNAISLNSVVMNAARVIGPAVGGVIIALVGTAVCFEVNAASYIAVLVALAMMRRRELFGSPPVERAKGQLRAGLRYAWGTPGLRDPLILVTVVGVLAYNFQVVLPLLAKVTFRGGAGAYSALMSAMAGGAVVGGLLVAARRKVNIHRLVAAGITFGLLILALAAAPNLAVAIGLIVPMGGASITFIATANSTLQLRADPAMRGRVMALYAVGFLGSTPIGGPLVGWISQAASPRIALLVGGCATAAASLLVMWLHRREHLRAEQPPSESGGLAFTT